VQHALALVPVLILVPVLAFLLPVLTRLMRASQPSEFTADWFENFQVAVYAPMQGLLAQDDFLFLSRQPGFDPLLVKKLRRDRLRIFREYMNRLIVDYNRLHTLAYFVISQSTEDQSVLFTHLLSMRFRFWLATVQVEFRYALCYFGANSISLAEILTQVDSLSKIALTPSAKAFLIS
jgi:hypothetical protein